MTIKTFCNSLLILLLGFAATAQDKPEILEFEVPIDVKEDRRWNETEILEIHKEDNLEAAEENDFTLKLLNVSQYNQSSRLVFELTNHTGNTITNFWLHVSLLDRKGLFLYREEPVFFVNLLPGKKGVTELYCESVGIEQIGYVVVYPMLLEKDRTEVSFEKEKVALVQFPDLPVRLAFYSEFNDR
jgi:hypothetical protein